MRQGGAGEERAALAAIQGKVAIANAKRAYQSYKRLFAGARWEKLRAKGARVQRLLWASTGTKNKSYSDVLYVDELIASDTVNTMPPATMDAFRDHGKPRPSLEENLDQADAVMAALGGAGISLDAVTTQLVEEGVQLFADAFDKLLGAVAGKRAAILGDQARHPELPSFRPSSRRRLQPPPFESWRRARERAAAVGRATRRLWSAILDEAKWLGWLGIVAQERDRIGALSRSLAADIRQQNFSHMCSSAGHGRIEPGTGGAGRDFREAIG